RKRPQNPTPDAARAQAATNGSPHPRVLNPAPLFLLGAGSRRGTRTSEKSRRRDASTWRGGCSVFTVTPRAGIDIARRRERHPLLAGRFLTGKAKGFQQKQKGKIISIADL